MKYKLGRKAGFFLFDRKVIADDGARTTVAVAIGESQSLADKRARQLCKLLEQESDNAEIIAVTRRMKKHLENKH